MAIDKSARSAAPGLKGVRVLVVEDGWQVADALKLSLEQMGMVVAGPVATAKEAHCLVADRNPGVAIVDVNLKGEMAYELMDWLHGRGIAVIVITGYEDLPRALRRFAAILHKPFTMATLFTTLERVMQRMPAP